jgi:hypothetical protein
LTGLESIGAALYLTRDGVQVPTVGAAGLAFWPPVISTFWTVSDPWDKADVAVSVTTSNAAIRARAGTARVCLHA